LNFRLNFGLNFGLRNGFLKVEFWTEE